MPLRVLIILLCMLPGFSHAAEETPAEQASPEQQPQEPEVDPLLLKEQAIAKELPANEVKWLQAAGSEILAWYRAEETGQPLGSLLYLGAPGDTVMSSPLTIDAFDYFPGVAWNIMALQLPGLSFEGPQLTAVEASPANEQSDLEQPVADDPGVSNALLPPADQWFSKQHELNQGMLLARVQAAQQSLQQEETGYVLVVKGYTASILVTLLQAQQLQPNGLVLLDLDHPDESIREEINSQLAELTLPVLDIYTIHTREHGDKRKKLARQANYQQRYLSIMADYRGNEAMLNRFIRNWLVKHFNSQAN
jgi:hypothetical protein